MKQLLILKILQVNNLTEAGFGFPVAACDPKVKLFQKPPVILTIFPKAGYDMYTGAN
jgi:hypothetical protein